MMGKGIMQFHRCLEQVFGTKTAIRILRTLARHGRAVFTVRRLTELSGTSLKETLEVLRRLERQGVIIRQPIGRSHQVTVNRGNYLYGHIVAPAVRAEGRAVEALIRVLRKHLEAPEIHAAAIFGSVSRGEEQPDSDIDLLVLATDRKAALTRITEARAEVAKSFGNGLAPLVMAPSVFRRRRRSSLVQEILRSSVPVAGRELAEVVRL